MEDGFCKKMDERNPLGTEYVPEKIGLQEWVLCFIILDGSNVS